MVDQRSPTVIVGLARNEKLGPGVWATWSPVRQTCPASCPLLDNGCYGQRGPGGHVARLERNAKALGMNALDLAREEGRKISAAAPKVAAGTSLRLHYAGDAKTEACVVALSSACASWPGPVWTYTHAWREISRDSWGAVSVLASVERTEDGRAAYRRGYVPALVVPDHPASGRAWKEHGITWIPCPAETRGRTCAKCKLCFDTDGAKGLWNRFVGIAFSAHGSGSHRVKAALVQLKKKPAGGGASIAVDHTRGIDQ